MEGQGLQRTPADGSVAASADPIAVDCALLSPEGLALFLGNQNQPIATFGLDAFLEETVECDGGDPPKCLPKKNRKCETKKAVDQLLKPLKFAPQATQFVPLPADGHVRSFFWDASAALIPWAFILIFKYSEYTVISTYITEKETKVREELRMMGVSNMSLIVSWYLTYGW